MYIPNGIKWGASTLGTPSGTITWDENLTGLDVASGSTVNDLVNSLQAAFTAWEDVAALNFSESAGGVDIEIGFASFSGDSVPENNGAVATASWFGGNFYSQPNRVEIEFNSDETWSPFADSDFTTVNFYAVALHEIGHVIGLGHTWEIGDPIGARDDSLIMNAVITADDLGDGDIAGAQALYGLDGDDEPVDAGPPPTPPSVSDGDGGGGAGILVGLLALVFGLFTGGFGAAAVLAAGRVAEDDEEADGASDADPVSLVAEIHPTYYLPEIPFENFAQPIDIDDGEDDDFFLF